MIKKNYNRLQLLFIIFGVDITERKMIEDIISNIIASIIWFLLGVSAYHLSRIYFIKTPTKKLWKISKPKELIICCATSTKTNTGTYSRPATGIGQVRALGTVVESLSKAYNIRIQNILLSINQIQKQIEKDIILLGGPKNNEITRLFLDKIRSLNIADQQMSTITWLNKHSDNEYNGVVKDQKIVKDFGLAIRMKNPFDSNKATTISLFTGCHTYGTVAAAQYYTEQYVKELTGLKDTKENVFLLVECDIVDGFPVDIKLIERHEF